MAGEWPSSLGAVRRPSVTQGSSVFHHSEEQRDIRDAFKLRWNLSTMPFASGLYAVVVFVAMPSRCESCVHKAEVKTEPLSDVI